MKLALVTIKLWDLPIRLFHWALTTAIIVSWGSGENGFMRVHYISGLVVIALLVFRLLWGIFGSPIARFSHFIRGKNFILAYLGGVTKRIPSYSIGHNPVGGLAVAGLLGLTALQAFSGLFIEDDVLFEGPLHDNVGASVAGFLGTFHVVNFKILLALIGLHLLSQLFYYFWKRENLVQRMLSGRAKLPEDCVKRSNNAGDLTHAPTRLALVFFCVGVAICAAIYFLN